MDRVRRRSAGFAIAEINRIEGLHEQLARLPGLPLLGLSTRARGRARLVEGVRSEDLTRLTYRDESFDLVLTSETLEHVPDLDAALSEIHRVLVPGGRHIFTIPLLARSGRNVPPGRAPARTVRSTTAPRRSATRAETSAIPCSPSSGPTCLDILRKAGFEVDVHFGPTTEDDLAQVYVCRKPDREPIDITEPEEPRAAASRDPRPPG